MKIIGNTSSGYIAEVSHDELEMLADKYYGKLQRLSPGMEFDLAAGYVFEQRIKDACRAMTSAMESFDRSRQTMLDFATMVLRRDGNDQGGQND